MKVKKYLSLNEEFSQNISANNFASSNTENKISGALNRAALLCWDPQIPKVLRTKFLGSD